MKHRKQSTDLQIRFNDIDIMGHVNNAVYQHYFDLGRLSYFETVFGEMVDWSDESLVLVHISIDFMNPLFLEDKAKVYSRIYRIGNKSIGMKQQVVKEADGAETICAESESVLSGYSKANDTSIAIPEKWKKRIVDFEPDFSL